jgi:hypothetical protein
MPNHFRAQAQTTMIMLIAAVVAITILGLFLSMINGVPIIQTQPTKNPDIFENVILYEKSFPVNATVLNKTDDTDTILLSVSRSLEKSEEQNTWTINTRISNNANQSIQGLYVSQSFPDIAYKGEKKSDYSGIEIQPKPIRIQADGNSQHANAVVTWLFQNVKPDQEIDASVTTEFEINESQVNALPVPRILAERVSRTNEPVPAQWDWTLFGLLIIGLTTGVAAYWYKKNQEEG